MTRSAVKLIHHISRFGRRPTVTWRASCSNLPRSTFAAGSCTAGRSGTATSTKAATSRSRRGGRVFLPTRAVCGAERPTGRVGAARRGVEVVESLATDARHGGATEALVGLAGRLSARLVRAGQPAADGSGGGGDSSLRGSGAALRRGGLGSAHGRATRVGIDASRAAPCEEGRRRMSFRKSAPVPFLLPKPLAMIAGTRRIKGSAENRGPLPP